jgi:putative phosphoribosyl transferase
MNAFVNRHAAGRILGYALATYANRRSVIVLGLPRGGVPVAYEVARELDAELDVLVVRKIGVPGQPEVALGAVASGGAIILNDAVVNACGATDEDVRALAARELDEVRRREQAFRGERGLLTLRDRTVIVVDDGAATGATVRVAIRCVRSLLARKVIVAIPVASKEAYTLIAAEADEVVCLETPSPFHSVGEWYRDFTQTDDDEVRALLDAAEALHADH